MRYMFWMYEGKVLASLPIDVLEAGDRQWFTDHLARDFGYDGSKIVVKVQKVNV